MSYAQNKPLTEYGDLNSQHHSMAHEAEQMAAQEAALQEEPPKLVVADGPGNLYIIKWTYGNEDIPTECAGHWNHAGKASDAISGALARMNNERATKQAVLAQEHEEALMQKEIAEEQERLEKEAAPKKAVRKATGKPVKV